MGKLGKLKWCLIGCSIVIFLLVISAIFIPHALSNTIKWIASNDLISNLRTSTEQPIIDDDEFVEMVVDNIGVSTIDSQPMVILKEKGGDRYLPVWIGLIEASAIAVTLQGVEPPRPLTPDLLCSIMDRLGASVDYIAITDLQSDIFYASIGLHSDLMRMEIDARPSDAIAIALRVKAPIYVKQTVLDNAGIQPETETW